MKTLIDRTCARYTEIRNKNFYFIVAAANSSKWAMERTLEGFRASTSCLSRAREKRVIYGTGAWNIGDIKGSRAMRNGEKDIGFGEIKEMGANNRKQAKKAPARCRDPGEVIFRGNI